MKLIFNYETFISNLKDALAYQKSKYESSLKKFEEDKRVFNLPESQVRRVTIISELIETYEQSLRLEYRQRKVREDFYNWAANYIVEYHNNLFRFTFSDFMMIKRDELIKPIPPKEHLYIDRLDKLEKYIEQITYIKPESIEIDLIEYEDLVGQTRSSANHKKNESNLFITYV